GVVAVREAAEALDDVEVAHRVVERHLAQVAHQRYRVFLVGDAFGMLEGQVAEHPQAFFDLLVQPGFDHAPGVVQGQRIGGVGMRAAAEDIARHLVEQDLQGKRAFGVVHPGLQFAARGGEVRGLQVPPHLFVEGVATAEPLLVAGIAPETDHLARRGQRSCIVHSSNLRWRTDLPWRRIRRSASMPVWMCPSTKRVLTCASEASVLTPSGIIGWSLTSSSAPLGMRLAKPAAKMVAVSMSMAMQRIVRRRSLNAASCSQARRLVV